MGIKVGPPSWYDQIGTGIGDALIGVNQPFGNLGGPQLPPNSMARDQAIRGGALNLGMNILSQPYAKPMEALGKGYQAAQAQGADKQKMALAAQQMMLEMDSKKRDEARKNTDYAQQQDSQTAWQDFATKNKALFGPVGEFAPYMKPEDALKLLPKPQGGNEAGLVPVWAKGPKGEWGLFQPNKTGGAPFQMQFPEGFTPEPQTHTVDLGTSIGTVENRGGDQVNSIPKDIAGVKVQEAVGEKQGSQIASAPADLQAANVALDMLDSIEKDPNMDRGTGFSSSFNFIPGTAGKDFQNKVDQAKSGAFLTAIQQMRGLGSLSNVEGETATAAVNRMNTATSMEEFKKALSDYRKIVEMGKAKAEQRLQTPAGQSMKYPGSTDMPDFSTMSEDQLHELAK